MPHRKKTPKVHIELGVIISQDEYALGGILSGADKLSRAAWLQSDPAKAQVLGVEAIASQSTPSRFFDKFEAKSKHWV